MLIENTEVYGFRAALRGMRNPMNSWDRSDSEIPGPCFFLKSMVPELPYIGPKDMELALKLINGGSEHRKFLRQIQIWVDFTLPRYVWQELDTYKVATVRMSCSTMHKLTSRHLEQSDFEDIIPDAWLTWINDKIDEAKSGKFDLNARKGLLPEGYLQKATYTLNYETALTIYHQRKNHRLPQWNAHTEGSICNWILNLPYMTEWVKTK
jgi:hypothetical protein